MGKHKEMTNQNQHKDDIDQIISKASRVIVPLSPISVFAARNPWSNLEQYEFKDVAQWLANVRDVDIYPTMYMFEQAYQSDEIDKDMIEVKLQEWLNQSVVSIDRQFAESYARTMLDLSNIVDVTCHSENKRQVNQHNEKIYLDDETNTVPLVSTYITDKDDRRLIDVVDYHVIKWCKLYLDDAQSGWTMPNREKGLFFAWQRLVQHDPALTKQQRSRLKTLPNQAETLIHMVLQKLGIAEAQYQTYLENHLLSLPGWAGMMLWQDEQASNTDQMLLSYLAIRLGIEWAIVEPYLPVNSAENPIAYEHDEFAEHWMAIGMFTTEQWQQLSKSKKNAYIDFALQFEKQGRRQILLTAWEATYAHQLEGTVTTHKDNEQERQKPQVQMAFCIDVRSEPFRRQIEAAGAFETIGIAGFFGLPIVKEALGQSHSHPSLPVMNAPQHKIKEYTHEQEPTTFRQHQHILKSITYTFKKMKQNALPSLLLPELSGPWLTLQMFSRSFAPRPIGQLIRKFYDSWLQKPNDTALSLDHRNIHEEGIPVGFTNEEKVDYAQQSLRLMGLTLDFAPLIVLCGHGSQSANNPYASSLDCGACGGAASGFNAKVLAQLCNLAEVRTALNERGIVIPEDTVFAAAEHQTSTDELNWIYLPTMSKSAQNALNQIQTAMSDITYRANAQRLKALPDNHILKQDPIKEVHRLSNDWSEIRPEWGLARNASFIIGPRDLTKNSDLKGRAFLHNYDWEQDSDGSLLANIISGPATVAQWINLQYYASTVAPHYYGSGSKTTQTITAGIGVMQGNASDLLTGLPWQSVMSADNKMYHSPIRLLIVVHAPNDYIKQLLNEHHDFYQKVHNGWVKLASIDEFGNWQHWSVD
ncbi:DUF2309 family protein [Staphylococcus cohnii]|uniref:DUF2309 domain-containing protein n=1 Tax=Staphylococcus cohnii TaxID=29382 RepID=UPI001CCF1A7F|nr:putative inorganic carbon transporter subunit DabA [Staphylococcus cohnii]MBZ8172649.1 DUF2309 family protein [Staphylococcus cohnii]